MTVRENAATAGMLRGAAELIAWINRLIQTVAHPTLTQLVLRVALAVPFWRSGILKWDGFLQLNEVAIYLFSDEFKLHLPGGPYPFPAPALVAFLAGSAEIILPILLVLGLGTRIAATGLLIMTLVVQLTEPAGWPIHITWAAMAMAIMAWGPERISLDYLIGRRSPTLGR
jgi:putative oxidoreductase